MALIPAGPFYMGGDPAVAVEECKKLCSDCSCSRGSYTDEEPIHSVNLNAYYIDIYEVTNARYAECVKTGSCSPPHETQSNTHASYYDNAEYANYPVIYVDWTQAKTYCEWRGGRLPTETEWEKAARGGLDGKKYLWGDDAPICKTGQVNGATFGDCSLNDTTPVGTYPVNGYGLLDMAGNVWEWVSSLYKPYPYDPQDGREDLQAGSARVLRGGSWGYSGNDLRVSFRGQRSSSYFSGRLGFRCAR